LEAASVHAPAGLHRISVPLLRLRSDDQLVALFRQGDDDAFQVIHERYRQRLFAYARQMLSGSRSDAEDAMQDVFLRAYGALRADDRPVTLRAWLYKVAHNRCIDQLRRPMPAAVDLFDLTRGPSLHDPLEEAERREDLRRLVSDVRRLPEQQRSALLMREMEGLTYKEMSDALAVSVPAVKSLLVRARIGLVESIEARDTACGDIRLDIAAAVDKGVRASGRARRHMRECSGCREYRTALRGELRQLNGLSGGHGVLGTSAKLLGVGGAGSGAAAGGGGGAVVVGGSAVATKVAVIACCAAVVGTGAVEVQQATTPARHHHQQPLQAAPQVLVSHPQAVVATPRTVPAAHRAPPKQEVVTKAAPAAPPVVTPETQPASDSTVVDQASGGMLAPDEATDSTSDSPTGTPSDTTTDTSTSTSTSTTTTGTGTATTGSGSTSGPDGGLTGSTPPSAQGATAPGAEKTPS